MALSLSSVFLFQNCATLISRTSQKIPVTSSPSGAKITVDGFAAGRTPLNLDLKRKKNHVILIKKEGHNPLEIRITKKTSLGSSILRNRDLATVGFFLGFIRAMSLGVFSDGGRLPSVFWSCIIGGTILGWVSGVLIDYISGANYTLSPKYLDITLTKIEGVPKLDLILLDAEQLRNIKRIRIRCDYSRGEDSEKN